MVKKVLQKSQLKESQSIPNYNDPNIYWATFDLGCSSAIISAGGKLVSLEKSNPHKIQFIFLKDKNIEKVVNDYWADKLEVKARTFFDNTKMLKNRIYSE